jgi:alginate O-acetyltransferase complex protein AlgI
MLPQNLRNYFITLSSIAFYVWGAPKYFSILAFSILFDFFIAKQIVKFEGRNRKLLLAFSVCVNVGLLLYFKYANFFVENISTSLTTMGFQEIKWVAVALPIGISFFTFHELSYVIDVYRGVKKPMKNIADYALYILLFPQLIAGPIVRFNEISDQIIDRKNQETLDNRIQGLFRFIIGLAKKVLIANSMAVVADQLFNAGAANLSTEQAWIGAIAYTFQIYFDFSGYSDMAIGMARMMGFKFPENFNNPYIAQSITDFWRRWHMTLSRWMRDYLYIPLGGNKVPTWRMYFNLWVVFIISGFWHGAEWNFLIWGCYHGLFLVFDKLFLTKLTSYIGKLPRIVLTFFLVVIGWVFFRADNLNAAYDYLGVMFSPHLGSFEFIATNEFTTLLYVAIFFSFFGGFNLVEKWQVNYLEKPKEGLRLIGATFVMAFLLLASLGSLAATGFNPFIYFRF